MRKTFRFATIASVVLAALLCVSVCADSRREEDDAANGSSGKKFAFAIIGDHPYDAAQEAKVPNLMTDLDAATIAFIIHNGDFKSGSSLCSDALFLSRYNVFQSSKHPFIYLFGDNEWTDCHRAGSDPLERLAMLRTLFTQENTSLGRKVLPLTRQSNDP